EAARAALHGEERRERVVRAREQRLDLEAVGVRLDGRGRGLGLGERGLVGLADGEVEEDARVLEAPGVRAPRLERAPERLQPLDGLLRLLGRVPEPRRGHRRLELARLAALPLEVKASP